MHIFLVKKTTYIQKMKKIRIVDSISIYRMHIHKRHEDQTRKKCDIPFGMEKFMVDNRSGQTNKREKKNSEKEAKRRKKEE